MQPRCLRQPAPPPARPPRAAALASRRGMRAPRRLPPPPPRAAAAVPPVDDADEREYEAALAALLAAPPAAVAPTARTLAPVALTLPFMLWLADREDGAVDARERAALAAVGAALTAAREGLDGGAPPLPVPPHDDAAIQAAVADRWRALGVARSATTALAPAALAADAAAAVALGTHVARRKAASAAALMGRVRLDPDAAAAALAGAAAGDAAGRILGLLLHEGDAAARLALLPDAFDPGDGGAQEDAGDTEQVWTTPLKLVAAIDLTLARMAGGADAGGASALTLTGACPAAPDGGDQLVAVLEELRAAALEYLK